MKPFFIVVIILVLLLPLFPGEPMVIGEKVSFFSKVLGENRDLWIYCPGGYARSSAKYPVLYLLDGDIHFHYLTGFVNFFAYRDSMPEMIVVAIPNTNRIRDLTPVHIKKYPGSGGGDNFLKFLKEDLFPYVENGYRTQPYRILAGHSLAAMFTVHILLTAPELFNAYIASSPSLHWGDRIVFKEAETYLARWGDLKRFFFYTIGGKEWKPVIANARDFEKLLREKAPKGLEWHFQFLENDAQGTSSHRSFCNGLQALYPDFLFPFEVPSLQNLDGLKKHFGRLSEKYGYTIPVPRMIGNLLGYDLMIKGNKEEAINVLEYNAGNYPEFANVFNLLGMIYEKDNQLKLAETNFQKACKLAEKNNNPLLKNFTFNLERVKKKLSSGNTK